MSEYLDLQAGRALTGETTAEFLISAQQRDRGGRRRYGEPKTLCVGTAGGRKVWRTHWRRMDIEEGMRRRNTVHALTQPADI